MRRAASCSSKVGFHINPRLAVIEDQTINGSTEITLMDQMRALFWGVSRFSRMAGAFSLIISMVLIGLLLTSSVFYSMVFVGWLTYVWIASAVFCLITPLISAVAYRRLSNEQKRISYEINSERILVRDGTGALLSSPWSVVRRMTETKSGFSLVMRPAGARWLCKRAFTADAIEALRKLAGTKLGRNARLKKQA
jgi:hypothetical protein